MKNFKRFDLWLQLAMIPGLVVYAFISGEVFVPYFTLGGYQLLSCFIHSFLHAHFYTSAQRRKYLNTLFWLLVLALISFPVWIYFGIALLFVSPVLAIWYVMICRTEYEVLQKQEFIHLK